MTIKPVASGDFYVLIVMWAWVFLGILFPVWKQQSHIYEGFKVPRYLTGWSSNIERHREARFILAYYGGKCRACTHPRFRRLVWLYRHLRDKHGDI